MKNLKVNIKIKTIKYLPTSKLQFNKIQVFLVKKYKAKKLSKFSLLHIKQSYLKLNYLKFNKFSNNLLKIIIQYKHNIQKKMMISPSFYLLLAIFRNNKLIIKLIYNHLNNHNINKHKKIIFNRILSSIQMHNINPNINKFKIKMFSNFKIHFRPKILNNYPKNNYIYNK